MPNEDSDKFDAELQPEEHGREHHQPQHASTKHERQVDAHNDGDAVGMSDEEASSPDGSVASSVPGGNGTHHKIWHWIASHKKFSIPLAVVLVLAVLAAIPLTRYLLAGTVLRKNYSILVTDSQTHKPVTSALVTLDGKKTGTDNKGVATLRVKVGDGTVAVSKKYYTSTSKHVLVPISKQKQQAQISLVATGRQVPVTVMNKITGKPAANVRVTAQSTEVKTDAKGEAILVVPADKPTIAATLDGAGYNSAKVTVKVTASADPANTFQVTPSGKLYFLSNKSGKIDIVKTNLDGTDRQTVLAGTGKEDGGNTVLLASQDWQYLALLSKRDGGDNPKLFLISTSNDALTTMDEGDASFAITGWSGHKFVYTVTRAGVQLWQQNRQALKAYDADASKTILLDQTVGAGHDGSYFSEQFGNVYIYTDEIVYAKNIQASQSSDIAGHQATLNSVKQDGSDKHAVKGWSLTLPYAYYNYVYVNVNTRAYAPNDVYVAISSNPTSSDPDNNLYEYEDGQLKAVSGKTANDLYAGTYSTYLFSPSNKQTFWSEPRDGKNTLFVGGAEGKDGKEVASLSEYQAYGWFTDKYLLLSKSSSELYIMPVAGGTPLKITDYYKPNVDFTGYGRGYGGL